MMEQMLMSAERSISSLASVLLPVKKRNRKLFTGSKRKTSAICGGHFFCGEEGISSMIPEVGCSEKESIRFAHAFFVFHLLLKQAFHWFKTKNPAICGGLFFCGEEGIRTLDTVSRIHTFQACLFNHSSTSPEGQQK